MAGLRRVQTVVGLNDGIWGEHNDESEAEGGDNDTNTKAHL